MEITGQAKTTAVVAYITIIGTIIAYFMNLEPKDKFASFHIRQAFGLHILLYLLGAFTGIFSDFIIALPLYIFYFVLWGYGVIMAIKGEQREIPILGALFQKWFSTIS